MNQCRASLLHKQHKQQNSIKNKKHALPIRLYSVQEGQALFSLFSLSPPADRRQLTASSVELAQLGREAKQSLSGGRSRLVRAAQELPVELHVADAQERRVGQRVREAVRHEHVERPIPASRRIMSRSCRRAARLACLTSSCGLGPRSARNRSLAPCWLRRLRKRSWFFRSRAVRCKLG